MHTEQLRQVPSDNGAVTLVQTMYLNKEAIPLEPTDRTVAQFSRTSADRVESFPLHVESDLIRGALAHLPHSQGAPAVVGTVYDRAHAYHVTATIDHDNSVSFGFQLPGDVPQAVRPNDPLDAELRRAFDEILQSGILNAQPGKARLLSTPNVRYAIRETSRDPSGYGFNALAAIAAVRRWEATRKQAAARTEMVNFRRLTPEERAILETARRRSKKNLQARG